MTHSHDNANFFIDSLNTVRTAICNAVSVSHFTGKPLMLGRSMERLSDELSHLFDFNEEFSYLRAEDLKEIGFSYLNDEDELLLMPMWLYLIVPKGTRMIAIDDNLFIKGEDEARFEIVGDEWANVGFVR